MEEVMTDIYKAPEAELTNPSTPSEYGSVEKALAGDYELKPVELLKSAWANLKGMKTTYWLASIVYLVIYAVVAAVLGFTLGAVSDPITGAFNFLGLIGQLILMLVMGPIGAGLYVIALKFSVGAKIEVGELFKHFDKTIPLFLVTMLLYIIVAIGFVLLIIPGIYLLVACSMAMPLVIDKNMGPWEALMTSRKAITHKWFNMLGFMFLTGLVVFVGFLALLVGALWAVPLVMLALATLYRDMFGIEDSTING